ncbi:protein FAM200A-like [Eleginops maclovinus]|uniref:protein FAM200A-like n=1 Tax=Eleginops maclovinus TaxID=56733 RepID=UPI003080E12B
MVACDSLMVMSCVANLTYYSLRTVLRAKLPHIYKHSRREYFKIGCSTANICYICTSLAIYLAPMDRFVVRKVPEGQAAMTEGQAATTEGQAATIGQGQASEASTSQKRRKRKYNEEYVKYGFTVTTDRAGEEVPLCFVCSTILCNEAMKPSKLTRHMETHHVHLKAKPVEYMQQMLRDFKGQQATMRKSAKINENALKASYLVALRVAKSKKPHTIAEQLILPAAIDMCRAMVSEECANKLKTIPLSDNTIGRRIGEMANDVKDQLMAKLQTVLFSLQIDETTDVTNDAQLLTFVRYEDSGTMCEEFLFCKPLPGRTTGVEIFKALDDFFTEHNISWQRCVALCSDGARAMSGSKTGLFAHVRRVAPGVIWTHCLIHREALASKDLSVELSGVFDVVVKTVNFIKRNALNTRLFSSLCHDLGSEHSSLLYHSEVRWLSRGAVLARVFELRGAIYEFLCEKHSDLASNFNDSYWLTKLAYLTDVFAELNKLNSSMQGRDANVMQLYEKLDAFVKKMSKWIERVESNNLAMFPSVEEYPDSTDINDTICEHLRKLVRQFAKYFTDSEEWRRDSKWILLPFSDDASVGSSLTAVEEDKLIEMSTDSVRRHMYDTQPLVKFWISCQTEFPQLAAKAMRCLLPFPTTYLCASGFSTLAYLKNKYRARLDPENDMRLSLSTISPRIDRLCGLHHAQISH